MVISDSMGRPWRHGITDVAIGVAGLAAVHDRRGERDAHGNLLEVTEVAVADELAAAGDLVKGKLSDIPVAVLRGLDLGGRPDDGKGAAGVAARPRQRPVPDGHRRGAGARPRAGRRRADGPDVTALHADVLATLATMALDPADGTGQAAIREGFYGLLAARPDATRIACAPGHVTASTLLLDAEGRRVLLTLHPRVGAWVQLGGHIEDTDPSLLAAAAREAAEESGIAGIVLDPVPVDLDVHALTCSLGLPTRHFDVQFVGRAPAGSVPAISSESDDLRWFEVTELPDGVSPELPHLIARAVRRVAGR